MNKVLILRAFNQKLQLMCEERKMSRGKNSLHDFFHFGYGLKFLGMRRIWINARLPVGGILIALLSANKFPPTFFLNCAVLDGA